MKSSLSFAVWLSLNFIILPEALSTPPFAADSAESNSERDQLQKYEAELRSTAEESDKQAKRTHGEQKQNEKIQKQEKRRAARETARRQKEIFKENRERENAVSSLIQADKRLVDAILKPLLKTLGLRKGGLARIIEVAELLQKIHDNHEHTALRSEVRLREWDALMGSAQQLEVEFANSDVTERFLENDPDRLDAELRKFESAGRFGQPVRDFILSYFSNVKEFKSGSIRAGAGCMIGPNAALGFGTVSHLSGRKQLTFCPELGGHFQQIVSFTLGCEASTRIGQGYLACRDKEYMVLGIGSAREHADFSAMSVSDGRTAGEHIGWSVGFGRQWAVSLQANIPICPIFKKYGFARRQLGIHYEEFLNGTREVFSPEPALRRSQTYFL